VKGDAASDARPVARLAATDEPAVARGRAPVFHVFAEMYARARQEEAHRRAAQAPANGGCS
jgi:hypothetical protein